MLVRSEIISTLNATFLRSTIGTTLKRCVRTCAAVSAAFNRPIILAGPIRELSDVERLNPDVGYFDGLVLDRTLNKAFWSVMNRGIKEQRIAYSVEENGVAMPIMEFARKVLQAAD